MKKKNLTTNKLKKKSLLKKSNKSNKSNKLKKLKKSKKSTKSKNKIRKVDKYFITKLINDTTIFN